MLTTLMILGLLQFGTAQPKTIVIDAGHQAKANLSKEPVAPNSKTMKTKVTQGATGVNTGKAEYELNLEVALQLQKELEDRGYEVFMCREVNDIDISNVERAQMANKLDADAFIRIHANSSEYPTVNGMMTICQTAKNPDNKALYKESRALSDEILKYMMSSTDTEKGYVWETDTMSGINWAQVPVTIVEMGYLSNPEEDLLLSTSRYQKQIVTGIADGLDSYFTLQTQ